MEKLNPPRVVIVGGGFGGLYAARALKRSAVAVTLLDRRNHHLFQPLLYQVATSALSPADIAYPIRSILRHQKNARVMLGEVRSIDIARRELMLDEEVVPYDYLILAAGAGLSYFGHDQWKETAPGLKSLEDALQIRRRILLAFEHAERESDPARRRALLTFVLVGAGPTGVEMAGAIAEISRRVLVSDFRSIDSREARIVLIEAGATILPMFPAKLSASAHRTLLKLGVEVRVNAPVREVTSGAIGIDSERIAAHTIIWAAGVQPAALTKCLGVPLDRAGRAIVEADLTIPGHPEVFVIGDVASFTHQGGRPLPGLAPVAMQQGRWAARNIARSLAGQPYQPFHYRDKGNMAVLGRGKAIAEIARFQFAGMFAWLLWIVVHILFLIGFRNRLVVLIEWAWAYVTDQRSARLITGPIEEPPTP